MTTTTTPSLDAALAELEAELGMLSEEVSDEPKSEADTSKATKADDGATVLDSLDELLELDLDELADAEAVVINADVTDAVVADDEKEVETTAGSEFDELENELAALEKELGADVVDVAVDEVIDEVVDEVVDEVITEDVAEDTAAELELLEELSAEGESEIDDSDKPEPDEPSAAAEEDGEPGEEATTSAKSKGKARACGTTNPFDALIVRLGGVSAVSANVVLTMADTERPPEVLREEFKEIVNSMAKKVGEKAVNLMAHLQGNASLSVYTSTALEMLFDKGTLTSKELFDRYMSRPYSEGTSRSQSGQLMQLLVGLKIAERDGKGVKLNNDSVLAAALESRMKEAA